MRQLNPSTRNIVVVLEWRKYFRYCRKIYFHYIFRFLSYISAVNLVMIYSHLFLCIRFWCRKEEIDSSVDLIFCWLICLHVR